ncbi:MAG: hypothetical protein ACLTZT_19015 [Butyricimonas faecalis]
MIDILEKRNDELTSIFLTRACDHSAPAVRLSNNRFLTIERLQTDASQQTRITAAIDDIQEYESYLFKQGKLREKIPTIHRTTRRKYVVTAEKMEIKPHHERFPQIDCGVVPGLSHASRRRSGKNQN